MAVQNTPTTISAYLKEVYADSIVTLVPEGVKVLDRVAFVESDKEPGGHYNQPLQLTHEFGFSSGTGAFALNAAVAHQSANAQINGNSLLLRSVISYDAAARASSSKKAFMKWSETKFIPMLASFKKRLEILNIYGQKGLAQVASTSVSGAVCTITLVPGSFATGIWAGSEGMPVDIYSALTSGTKRTAGGIGTVTTVVLSQTAPQVIVTCANSTDAGNVAANDYIFFGGSYSTNEMAGLHFVVSNASGSLYGVSASSYQLFAGNSYDCKNAPLTMGKILAGLAQPIGKGLEEKITVLCSQGAFANLNSDMSQLTRKDGSYSKKKNTNGSESLEYVSANGSVEIVPSIYIKNNHAIAFPESQCSRIGSTDTTMTMPGQDSNQLVLQVPDVAAYEMRLYTEQTFFCARPGWTIEFTNVANQ